MIDEAMNVDPGHSAPVFGANLDEGRIADDTFSAVAGNMRSHAALDRADELEIARVISS